MAKGGALQNLTDHLRTIDLFNALDAEAWRALEKELELREFESGEAVCYQGDPGDSMYVLFSGRLTVCLGNADGSETIATELEPGAIVGEMALLTGQVRTATIRALQNSQLVRFSKAGFERLADSRPHLVTEFARRVMPRLQLTQLANILTSTFGDLDPSVLRQFQAEAEWRHLGAGEILFRQGDHSDAMYVVVNGRLRIAVQADNGDERIVGESGPGQLVGEFALLAGEPHSATAYALREAGIARISRALFERLVAQSPEVLLPITRLIINRSRSGPARDHKPSMATNIVVLPVGGSGQPLGDFAERLTQALSRYGSTLHLSSERFDVAYGKSGVAMLDDAHPIEVSLKVWLGEQERHHQHIVYEADATWSPWTRRCLRQADRILLVGMAGDSPDMTEIEREMKRRLEDHPRVRTELILIQSPDLENPSGTAQWLDCRKVDAHHHVRRGSNGDFLRLARFLTGRAVGLTLGGGGGRGFTHIGVIRAMRELDIPIDWVGGTSIGAIIGAHCALRLDHASIARMMQWSLKHGNPMNDYTLPLVSLLSGAGFERTYSLMFQDTRIEDLWLNFFAVTANLTTGQTMVHERGLVRKYVRASSSIPGLVPPVPDDGCLLADGGLLNNLPADIMRQKLEGKGIVIAVNVNPTSDLYASTDYGQSLSGWSLALQPLNVTGPKVRVPNIHAILDRMTCLSSIQQAAKQVKRIADVYMHPPIGNIGVFDLDEVEAVADVGYRYARPLLADWAKLRKF